MRIPDFFMLGWAVFLCMVFWLVSEEWELVVRSSSSSVSIV